MVYTNPTLRNLTNEELYAHLQHSKDPIVLELLARLVMLMDAQESK